MLRINSFVTPDALKAGTVMLSVEESHHLARVLRVEAGQELTLFDGQGTRAIGTIKTVDKKATVIQIGRSEVVPPPAVEITLIQAVCKPDRFELILQKAVELGVRTIQPVTSRHTINSSKDPKKQYDRWQTIIRNASQQCGTAWLPTLKPLQPLAEVPLEFDAAFIGSLHPNAKPFRGAFSVLDRSALKTAALLIGPEGDFTAEEVERAAAAGATPVTFGKNILRTETAALFGLSVMAYELFRTAEYRTVNIKL